MKPIVPGHVLLIPKKVVARVKDLDYDEFHDLFEAARLLTPKLEEFYGAEALNIAIQDGAGV